MDFGTEETRVENTYLKTDPDLSNNDTVLSSKIETETKTEAETQTPTPDSDPVLILDEKYKRICKIVKKRDVRPSNFIAGSLGTIKSNEWLSPFPDNNDKHFSKGITEGFGDNTVTVKEGFEDSKKVGEAIKPYLTILYGLFESPLRYINSVEESMTNWYSNKLSNGECSNSDKKIVKSQFQVFLNTLISFIIVYNWYYMMFFKSGGAGGSRVKPCITITTDALTEYNKFISLFFKYNIVPVSILNWFLLKYVPKWEVFITKKKLLNQRGIFVLLLLFIINVVQHHGSEIIDGIVKSIHMKTDSYTGLFIASYLFYAIYSQFQIEPDFMGIRKMFNMYMILTNPLSSMFRLILFFIRFAWTAAISFVSGFLVYSYLLVMSFFAITIHSSGTFGNTVRIIHKYIKNSNKYDEGGDDSPENQSFCDKQLNRKGFLDMPEPPSICNPMTIFQKIVYYITVFFYTIIKYCFKYTFEFILVCSLLNSINVFSKDIKNANLRIRMIITCCVIIALLCGYSVKRYFSGLVESEIKALKTEEKKNELVANKPEKEIIKTDEDKNDEVGIDDIDINIESLNNPLVKKMVNDVLNSVLKSL